MSQTCVRDEIVERLATVALALDTKDWPLLGSLFVEDATGYGKRGREAIVAQTRAHLDGVGATQHLLGNHRVTVDDTTARSLTYARVHHVGIGPMEGKFFECMGEYDDRWRRTANGWQLTHRAFDMQIMLGDFAVLRG
nr:nuclear transport factor 2 family protein [Nocardioides daedukensis]